MIAVLAVELCQIVQLSILSRTIKSLFVRNEETTTPVSMSDSKLQSFEPPLFIGVDVGGTNIKMGVVDNRGRVFAHTAFPTCQHLGPQYAVEQAHSQLQAILRQSGLPFDQIAAAGLGTPGTMDVSNGMILEPPNLPGWRHFPIRDAMSQAFKLPVTFANDANAAAYGEFWIGAGREHASLVLFTLGTGVGGGIVVDNFLVEGANSFGGEVGHITIDWSADSRICSCGRRGHLEAYASATALVDRTHQALASGRNSKLQNRKSTELAALDIAIAAGEQDELALQLVLETAGFLARGIVVVAHLIDPHAIMLGGAMNFGGSQSELGKKFLSTIREHVVQTSFPEIAANLVIDFASLGSDAGFIGAAGLARVKYWQTRKPSTPAMTNNG